MVLPGQASAVMAVFVTDCGPIRTKRPEACRTRGLAPALKVSIDHALACRIHGEHRAMDFHGLEIVVEDSYSFEQF